MCFRIVKTDTKGNIRLIYSGNGKCNASDGAYIASNITHYESPIDLWYQETLLTKYSSYITFNELCIDDNFYSGQVGHLYSNTYDRLNRQVGEAFGGEVICSSPKNIANVTLLTADEVVYAGGVIGKENKYFYLNDKADFSWWLYNKSEQTVSGEDIYFVLDSNGKLSGEIGNMANQYIRPVITLRKEVEIREKLGRK